MIWGYSFSIENLFYSGWALPYGVEGAGVAVVDEVGGVVVGPGAAVVLGRQEDEIWNWIRLDLTATTFVSGIVEAVTGTWVAVFVTGTNMSLKTK